MKKALLISIHPEWAQKILNGEKTIEIRTWIPKDYAGWVYVYITKGKPFICKEIGDCLQSEKLNGKVAFRFWYEKVDKIENLIFGCAVLGVTQNYLDEIMKKSCLSINQLAKYLNKRDGYAWHIDNLEVFDKTKELSEFEKELYYETPGGWFPCYQPLTKAPKKCAWVYGGEQL